MKVMTIRESAKQLFSRVPDEKVIHVVVVTVEEEGSIATYTNQMRHIEAIGMLEAAKHMKLRELTGG